MVSREKENNTIYVMRYEEKCRINTKTEEERQMMRSVELLDTTQASMVKSYVSARRAT